MAHLTGCSIEKRRYTGGFHIEHHRRNTELIALQPQGEPPTAIAIAIDERNDDTMRVELTTCNDARIAVIEKPNSNGKKIQQDRKSAQKLFGPVALEAIIMQDVVVKRSSSVHPDALGSFVCGLGSMGCFFAIVITSLSPFLLFIGLLVTMLLLAFLAGKKANRAFKDMHYARNRYTGKALAAAGMVMGVLSFVAFIGLVLIVIFGIAFTAFT